MSPSPAPADRSPARKWGSGPRPILALHCALAHGGAWADLAQNLQGVTLTAPDHPGHGRNRDWDGVQDLHQQATAEALAHAHDLAKDGPIDLFGHSFGGTLALRIALENPGLVRALVLVEPVLFAAARATQSFAQMAASQLNLAQAIAADREAAAASFHAEWGTGEALADLPERPRRYITERIHLIPAANPGLVDDNAHLLRPEGLESLKVPVLLVEGGKSPAIVGAIHDALAQRITPLTRAKIDDAGHMLPLTHAKALAALVQTHLAKS
ncbi:alpha/beta fold hydrolase [Xinfangfangia sp. CPCC 101601]|uniref:Alpha/beta fold hydrolase n=1 Tax=Pseudogemmobacter lacusdianii TaxID=3069608 RepID=A0ABU0W043_9RHOB|nr:alpha/beta fold hydrolase [Xinfangfangia sp. CPCC 101601]MDQ2067385.1 alpha/beta fold hydrolase [Xinfangfangia sp. CPCC 101601]